MDAVPPVDTGVRLCYLPPPEPEGTPFGREAFVRSAAAWA